LSAFQIIDEKRYPLKTFTASDNVDLLPFYRWEHRVTVAYKGKRYMAFLDNEPVSRQEMGIVYIEDITSGELKQIKDDDLFEELSTWVSENGFLNLMMPIPKPVDYNMSNKQKVTIQSPIIRINKY
jgi:hypothetical protein